jgi:hypothetical protein
MILESLLFDLKDHQFVSAPLFPVILETLVQLRPLRVVLADMDWSVSARAVSGPAVEGDARDEVMYRLTGFLNTCAK